MPDPELQERADRRLEQTLERTGARDPRSFYRDRLRELKAQDPSAYERAVRHWSEVLIPAIAEDDEDPLEAWTEYGRKLAELTAPGRTISVDRTGRAHPFERAGTTDRLVLHLPRARKLPVLLVGLPPDLSPAQRATYDWLVAGQRTLRG